MDSGEQINSSSLIKPLIQGHGYEHSGELKNAKGVITKEDIVEEVKKQLWLAGPLICVSLLQSCLQLISVMFVGHLGELALSGASMATSFASVTGFSLLGLWWGILCALLVQVFFLLIVTARINWNEEAKKAGHRVHDSAIPVEIVT